MEQYFSILERKITFMSVKNKTYLTFSLHFITLKHLMTGLMGGFIFISGQQLLVEQILKYLGLINSSDTKIFQPFCTFCEQQQISVAKNVLSSSDFQVLC